MSDAGGWDLTFWVVFFDAQDYPGAFVVRRQITGPCYYCGRAEVFHVQGPLLPWPSLDAARATIPEHLHRMPRDPSHDPPTIVETWF